MTEWKMFVIEERHLAAAQATYERTGRIYHSCLIYQVLNEAYPVISVDYATVHLDRGHVLELDARGQEITVLKPHQWHLVDLPHEFSVKEV